MRYVPTSPKDSFDLEVYEEELMGRRWGLIAKMMRVSLKEATGDDYRCIVVKLNNRKQIQFQFEKVEIP